MIIAEFKDGYDYASAYGLWQWDYGQVLRIQGLDLPTAVEIHFSLTETGGEAVTRVGTTKDGVTDVVIPDSMLENNGITRNYYIYVFVYLADETSGETTKKITLQVKARPKPEAFDAPGDDELFREAIAAVNECAERAEAAQSSAEEAAKEAQDSAKQAEQAGTDSVAAIQAAEGEALAAIEYAYRETGIVCEAAGELIQVTDSSDLLISDFSMTGVTEQESTTGAQLWDESNESSYANGRRYVFQCEPNTDYTLSTDVQVGSLAALYGEFNTANIHAVKYNATELTFNSGDYTTLYMQVYQPENSGGIKVMLNAGSTALPWEPYTGGAPSPSPDYPQEVVSAGSWNEEAQKWEYEISVGGAQLFDISKVITEEGVVINNGDGTLTVKTAVDSNGVAAKSPHRLRDYCPDIVSGKTYYLYADSTGSEKVIYFGKSKFMWDFGSSRIITDDDLDSIVYFYASGISTEATVSNIMITEVSNAPYEQYKPPQTVLLTSDRPLTKWDKLEKRNGQWGWVYKSAEIVLDGSEQWFLTGVTSDEYQGFALRSSDYNAMESNLRLVCDRFAYSTSNEINTCSQTNSEYGLRFVVSIEYVPNKTVADWENWLQSNPITVLYQLAEPTFVPLSETEQEQMNALHTNYPTTVVTNDQGCGMVLTYVADTENYIAQRYVPQEEYEELEARVAALETAAVNNI